MVDVDIWITYVLKQKNNEVKMILFDELMVQLSNKYWQYRFMQETWSAIMDVDGYQ